MLSNLLKAARQIIRGDDHINPKKLLEREKYLYVSLLALKLRYYRLKDQNINYDNAYDAAVADLEDFKVDAMTNVDLRMMMQKLIRPQVDSLFHVFLTVDEQLGVGRDEEEHSKNFVRIDDQISKDILLQEFEEVKQNIAGRRQQKDRNLYFWKTKQHALETVLVWHKWIDGISAPPESSSSSLDAFGMDMRNKDQPTIDLIRQHQTLNLCRSALIRQISGYSILCLRSNISGRGLFVDGNCLAGTLVAFQPGDVWPKEHLMTSAPDVMQHFENDDHSHISLRFDDYIIDSRQAPVTVLSCNGSLNPFALGHMANHSFPEKPNCLSTMVDFAAFPDDRKLRYVPNSYARQPTWQSRFFDREEILMHGLALLAKRDVRNEELTYDYRLQSNETPGWYSPVSDDCENSSPQVVFFRKDWQDN